ncbi:MAG: hypothetical protein QXX12_07010 [Nanopusillaceae archaeon]
MVVILDDIIEIKGTVTIDSLNVEYTIIDITNPQNAIVEGYIDLSTLTDGDTLELVEYIDNKIFSKVSFVGAQAEPIIRLENKMLPSNTPYKITFKLASGSTPKTIAYAILVEVTRKV